MWMATLSGIPSSSLTILFLSWDQYGVFFLVFFLWQFRCVAVLSLYFSAYQPISSSTVGIFKFLSIFSFLTYYGAFIILFSIFDCSDSSLFMWLIAVVPHSGIPYVQIDFIIILYIFNLFSMLSLEFRLVNRYIYLLFIRILSIIDLVCCFHVSCVSKWSPRYLTCLVCHIYVANWMAFNWIVDGFHFLSVNVIWLHLLGLL